LLLNVLIYPNPIYYTRSIIPDPFSEFRRELKSLLSKKDAKRSGIGYRTRVPLNQKRQKLERKKTWTLAKDFKSRRNLSAMITEVTSYGT
jgi:hypothetical protein